MRGRRETERLQIEDLDTLVTSDGKRRVPLLRILRAFGTKIEEQGAILRFTPEGLGPIELDVANKQIQIKEHKRAIDLIQAVSEITQKPDIFVFAPDLEEVLDIQLQWDTQLYEYRVQLDRQLSLWTATDGSGKPLSEITSIAIDLPEALPRADLSRDGVQFVELQWDPQYNWRTQNSTTAQQVSVGGMRETVWGNVEDGRYEVRLAQPGLTWSTRDHWRWANDDLYAARVDWFEWTHRLASGEVTVGDSTFALSNLVYPGLTATGVRVNGMAGWTPEELKLDRSGLGMRQSFGRPQVFEGPAPVGATVELLLNGRRIEVQNASPQADSPPGMGVYRFRDVRLPDGTLNIVTIVIKEANGNEIRLEKRIMGAPQLVPEGCATYLGFAGSKREMGEPGTEVVKSGDFYGYVTGGRVLYGLTDHLTVGTAVATEDDQYHRLLHSAMDQSERPYPASSHHAGTTFSYLPFDNLLLSGDVGASQTEASQNYGDVAERLRAEFLPTQKLSVNADLLDLGSHYFDGTNPDTSDRRGGEVGLRWKLHKQWSLDAGAGDFWNNLDGHLGQTTTVDYQNLGLQTSILPHTSLSARAHYVGVSSEPGRRILTELGLDASPGYNTEITGRIILGSGSNADNSLSALRLQHAPGALSSSQYWAVRKRLDASNALTLSYRDSGTERAVSLAHDTEIPLNTRPLRLREEVTRELGSTPNGQQYAFRVGAEYLLDRSGYNRLSASGEYSGNAYAFFISLSLRSLFANHRGHLVNVNSRDVYVAYGAVHGKVFLDTNGNHVLDGNEPGVAGVKVGIEGGAMTVTDKTGYYVLSASPRFSEVRVYLDATTVPATYAITHGKQMAVVSRDTLTEVNLSLAPMIAIVGRLMAIEPNDTEKQVAEPNGTVVSATVLAAKDAGAVKKDPNALKPIARARVTLSNQESGLLVANSVTGEDGTYYLGDIQPGRYVFRVDPQTLDKQYEFVEQERVVEVKQTQEDFVEITLPDFVAIIRPKAQEPDNTSPPEAVKQDGGADPNQAPR